MEAGDSAHTEDTQTALDSCEGSSQGSTVQSTTKKRTKSKSASGYERALRSWSAGQQAFLQEMQESQNRWIMQQQEQNRQHDERMISHFIEESSRSTERLIGQFFEGLRGILPHPSQAAPHWQPPPTPPTPQQQHQQHYRPHTQPQYPYPNPQPENSYSDYTYQDLD